MTSLLEGRATPEPTAPTGHDDTTTIPVAQWGRIAVRLLVAVLIAGAACLAITAVLPRGLHTRTDIVGAPTFDDFDIKRYWTTYLVWVVVFPAITLLLYTLLPRAVPSLGRTEGPVVVVSRVPAVDLDAVPEGPRILALLGRVGVVGLGVGIVLGLRASATTASGWGYVLGGTLGYLVAVGFIAVLVRGLPSRSLGGPIGTRTACSTVNLLLSPFLLLGVYAVSRRTSLLVVPTGEVRNFSWIPFWVPLAAVVALLAADVRHISRHGLAHIGARERRRIVFVAVPVILFLLRSQLLGAVGPPDMFHDGERLTGALLLKEGLVPWRDFFPVHGLLADSLEGFASFTLVDESVWGLWSGDALLITPLFFVSLYLLCALLFERSWVFLAVCATAFVFSPPLAGGMLAVGVTRFLLTPLLLCAFLLFLRRATWVRAGVLAGLLVGQTILTPESAYYLVIIPPLVIAYDLRGWRRGQPFWSRLRRTRMVAVAGVAWSVLAVAVLAALGALGSLIDFFVIFGSDHELTGGLPIAWGGFTFAFAAYAVPTAVVVSTGYVIWRLRSRRALLTEDWVAMALAAYAAIYYRKFLSRADSHVFQSYAVALPLVLYIAYRATQLVGGFWRTVFVGARRPRVAPQTVVVLLLVPVVAFPWRPTLLEVGRRVQSLPDRVHVASSVEYLEPRLGYSLPAENTTTDVHDLTVLLDQIGPDARIYDFSNQPALYNFLLGEEVISRYTNVSTAIRETSQAEVIDTLDEVRPEVIGWIGDSGLPSWDYIPNTVRHYDISEHILRNYRPWVKVDGQMLLLRNDLPAPAVPVDDLEGTPSTTGLYFSGHPCDWGQAANFLSTGPGDEGAPLRTRPVTALVDLAGWAVDGRNPVASVVVTLDGEVAMTLTPTTVRPDVAARYGTDPAAPVGFSARVPDVSESGTGALRVFAVRADGTAQALPGGSGPTPSTLVVDGRAVPVVAGAASGNIDVATVTPAVGGRVMANPLPGAVPAYMTRLDLPIDAPKASWLVLEDPDGLPLNAYNLTDQVAAPGHSITFGSKAGREHVAVQVGACPQWYGWGSDVVYLEHVGPLGNATWRLAEGSPGD